MPSTARGNKKAGVLLYDGRCVFCRRQAQRLQGLTHGRVELLSFQEDGVLAAYPGLTVEACMKEMKYVAADGRRYGGAEAAARALRDSRPFLGRLALMYYVPVVRQTMDAIYRSIAERRYKLKGEDCPDGTCSRHGPSSP
jgi:predicted DCC family thiol-disulfide oxidoreductase YuxK